MKRIFVAAALLGAAIVPVQADERTAMVSTFESPVYSLGDLHGQGGWSVNSRGAIAIVQRNCACGGDQSVMLGSGTGKARASLSLDRNFDNGFVMSGSMRAPSVVLTNFKSPITSAITVTGTDGKGNDIDVTFGVMRFGSEVAKGVKPLTWNYFVEYTINGKMVGRSISPVKEKNFAGWHSYELLSNPEKLRLNVDNMTAVSIPVALKMFTVTNVTLSSVYARGSVAKNTFAFFDDLMLGTP